MKVQQDQMEKITELLLAQAEKNKQPQDMAPPVNYPKTTPDIMKPKKPKKPVNMKTASTLSWVFPGMGHYYSGRTGKGILFTGLELAALAGVAITSSNYSYKVDEYNTFENNVVNVGGEWTHAERKQYFDAKNNALLPLIGSSTAAGIVWVWNVWDIKKSVSSKYSDSDPISIGINSRRQIEVRISF